MRHDFLNSPTLRNGPRTQAQYGKRRLCRIVLLLVLLLLPLLLLLLLLLLLFFIFYVFCVFFFFFLFFFFCFSAAAATAAAAASALINVTRTRFARSAAEAIGAKRNPIQVLVRISLKNDLLGSRLETK